ncbi:hypothetical protein ACGFI9_16755 [Micromonospora sp. NPDC048930]|uniref:hypothetical protein n=1 Tax=Micromonospora sp. NPDC048930 TaxID=3364261 RepID=UPI003721D385
MSESGQPGAATPGEHGDGTGQHDDLARTGSGWAPPATGWARGAPAPGGWPRSDLAGWATSSPRHGDLPAPLPGLPAAEPSARVNGHHVNGVSHAGEESPVTRQAPVSAPPLDEPRRETDGDRLVVPAQRPAPAVEQPAADAESGPARHASDEPPAGPAPYRAEGGVPSSAPPALQVPPVGAAASGFEVPPGFHAPSVERAAADEPPSLSRGWADRHQTEPPSLSRGWAEPSAPTPPTEQDWSDRPASAPPAGRDWSDRPASAPPAGRDWADRPASAPPAGPVAEQGWAGGPASAPPADRDAGPGEDRRAEQPRAMNADDRAAGPANERRAAPADEPGWSRASWNRPSWGGGWAPPWAREEEPAARPTREDETVGRRAAEPEPVGRRAEEELPGRRAADAEPVGRRAAEAEPVGRDHREDGPVGRRARDERAAEWAPEPARPYEPARAEQFPAYEPSRGNPEPHPVPEPAARETPERPAWAGPPVPVTPFSAPPHAAPTSAPPVPRETSAGAPSGYAGGTRRAEERDGTSYRPRGVAEEAGERPGQPPTPEGQVSATSGPARFDRTPASTPTSAPAYAARRSAPDPVPPAEPVADHRPAEPAAVLPQRVPAEPDVPVVPEPPAVEPSAETPELARIATHLRRDDEPAPLRERPEGFDVNAILDAVREVPGVRDAALRRTPAGAHSLRLDLADGADPAEVSRVVARLLQERMGLAAAPQNLPGAPATPAPPVRRRSAASRAAEPRPAEDRPTEVREGRPAAPESRTGRLVERPAEEGVEPPRRRRQAAPHRGRAAVEESSLATAPAGGATGSPATVGTSYSGGQMTTTETAPSRPLDTGGAPGPRVVIDHVQVSTFGLDATVEVRLIAGDRTAEGHATGPAVDGYVLRLCAVAAAAAVDELLGRAASTAERGRCFVEHAAVLPFGNCEVATVVVLLVCDGWVEQLAGSALVAGDPRQAMVRATLAAVNRRLEALLA